MYIGNACIVPARGRYSATRFARPRRDALPTLTPTPLRMPSKALVSASTRPLILSLLRAGESYGYEIIERVRSLSGGSLEWSDGMLYPVLRRLESEGLVRSRWVTAENERRRRYYRLTPRGEEAAEAARAEWSEVSRTLAAAWAEGTR